MAIFAAFMLSRIAAKMASGELLGSLHKPSSVFFVLFFRKRCKLEFHHNSTVAKHCNSTCPQTGRLGARRGAGTDKGAVCQVSWDPRAFRSDQMTQLGACFEILAVEGSHPRPPRAADIDWTSGPFPCDPAAPPTMHVQPCHALASSRVIPLHHAVRR